MFIPTEIPTYYWNNLKIGTYTFKFININNGELLSIKSKDDYFKYEVVFIDSNVDFYGNKQGLEMNLVLPTKGFTIALNMFNNRTKLDIISNKETIYVTIFKKNKKILRILDISEPMKDEKFDNIDVKEEFIRT